MRQPAEEGAPKSTAGTAAVCVSAAPAPGTCSDDRISDGTPQPAAREDKRTKRCECAAARVRSGHTHAGKGCVQASMHAMQACPSHAHCPLTLST